MNAVPTPDAHPVAAPGDRATIRAAVLAAIALLVPGLGLVVGIFALASARRARREGTTRDGLRTAAVVLASVAIAFHALFLLLVTVAGLTYLTVQDEVAGAAATRVATV